jgi:hypothetical protein
LHTESTSLPRNHVIGLSTRRIVRLKIAASLFLRGPFSVDFFGFAEAPIARCADFLDVLLAPPFRAARFSAQRQAQKMEHLPDLGYVISPRTEQAGGKQIGNARRPSIPSRVSIG